jgi:hypothetical protein
VFILADRFVGKNPRGNNGKNEEGDYNIKGPPICIHSNKRLDQVKIGSKEGFL